jgi:hypothetical protein
MKFNVEFFLMSEWGVYLDFAFESFIIFTIDFVKDFSLHCDITVANN